MKNTTEQNLLLEKKLIRWANVATVVVLGLIAAMGSPRKLETGIDFSFLPPFHSSMNALSALILLAAFWAVKNGRIELHRRLIYAAIGCSLLFLGSYLLYHFTTPHSIFGDANHDGLLSGDEKSSIGSSRVFYLVLLNLHIVAAAVSFPFILRTFIRAFTGQFERHKRMARWVFWLWFFVAATGPICYLLLKPYYR